MKQHIFQKKLMMKIFFISILFIGLNAYADNFPCEVHSAANQLKNSHKVIAYINHVWDHSEFNTFPSPSIYYDTFHDLKVVGYIDDECYRECKDQL